MRFEIIVEWFDTKNEIDRMEIIPYRGTLAQAKGVAKDRLYNDSITANRIPNVARVEDHDEKVVAVFEWVNDKAQELREPA